MNFAVQHCIPCEGKGILPLSETEAQAHLGALAQGWELQDEAKMLFKEWRFKNFAQAKAFVDAIAEIAETENHHPDLAFGWGYVRVSLTTHAVGGLHANDFIVAAKIDAAA
jgi:4a-hydroxytetrahydrobiopterin dehydratase